MGRVFACSDLHGQYDKFLKLKSIMQEDDICYVLGDCVDRGPGSIKILLEIVQDERFKMLMGNHEDMMLETLAAAEEGYMDFQLWYGNGGYQTHMEFMEYDRETQIKIISFLKKLPYKLEYKDIVLTHAGFSFELEEYVLDDILDEDRLIWDRSHIESTAKSKLGKMQVHGHTPTAVIDKRYEGKILQYHEQKICIDTGSCFGYSLGLIDLDTLEFIYI